VCAPNPAATTPTMVLGSLLKRTQRSNTSGVPPNALRAASG
jgi:hypothetical protein